jgi:hypothetical protein
MAVLTAAAMAATTAMATEAATATVAPMGQLTKVATDRMPARRTKLRRSSSSSTGVTVPEDPTVLTIA